MLIQRLIGEPGREICVAYRWLGSHAPAIIICPGVAVSMSEPRYLLSILARQCSDLGFNVFQFDYVGNGDSAGTYLDVSLSSLLGSVEQVLEFVESLGCSQVGIVGYGIGNLVASLVFERPLIAAVALLSPHFLVFSGQCQEVWSELAEISTRNQAGPVYPQVWHSKMALGMLWRATVGENMVPAQPCGPLNALLLWQLRTMHPHASFSQHNKPMFIMSEREDDAIDRPGSPIAFELIRHCSTLYKPSWHWCAECREHVLACLTSWLRERFGTPYLESPKAEELGLGLVAPSVDSYFVETARQYPLAVEVEGQSVLGILHTPPASAPKRQMCVIYEPGIPGQRVDIHCCGPRLAQALAREGFPVFRYDGRDMGVSAGEFHEFTWSRKAKDLTCIMDHLAALDGEHMRQFAILGNSAGARTACLVANRSERICACVFWGPILIEPAERVGERVVKRHSSGTLVTEYCGLWLGIKYNLDERRYNFAQEFEVCRKPSLILFASNEENLANKETVLEIASKRPEYCVREIEGTHGFSPEAIGDAIDASVSWLAALAVSLTGDVVK